MIIKTPSRLHLGFLDLRGDLGRIYGSIGVGIEKPNTILRIESSDSLEIKGYRKEEILRYAEILTERFGIEERFKIDVIRTNPRHVGLGSGTQLALAVGFGLSKLFNIEISIEKLSSMLGRGKVSGAGTYVFKLGGFVIDAGKRIDDKKIPPLLFHHEFPEDWYWIVGIPRSKGLSGRSEEEAFKLITASKHLVGDTLRITWMKLVPGLLEKDIVSFGEALTLLDEKSGECFSKAQHGIHPHPTTANGIKLLLEKGAYGAGQSSWGPSFYGLAETKEQALDLRNGLENYLSGKADIFITNADNIGVEYG